MTLDQWHIFTLLCQLLGSNQTISAVNTANKHQVWPAILRLSSHYFVTTNLYWGLFNKPAAWDNTPSFAQDYLENIFKLNRQRNQQIMQQACEVITRLNQADIMPLVLKNTGLLLSNQSPDLGYRLQVDIDLLIPAAQLQQAAELLTDTGYSYSAEVIQAESGTILQVVSREQWPQALKRYAYHQHLPPLLSSNGIAAIELHRHAYSRRFQSSFPLAGIFDRAKQHQQHGIQILTMSDADYTNHLLYHSYIGDGFAHRFELPLRTACDWLNAPNTGQQACPKARQLDQRVNALFNKTLPYTTQRRHLFFMRCKQRSRILQWLIKYYSLIWRGIINVYYNPQKLNTQIALLKSKVGKINH